MFAITERAPDRRARVHGAAERERRRRHDRALPRRRRRGRASPFPAVAAPTSSGRAEARSARRSSAAPSRGRACASTAAAPATTAAEALDPLTVANRGVPSAFAPGSAVSRSTPGATRSGFTPPVEGEAARGERRDAARGVHRGGARRTDRATARCARPRARASSAASRGRRRDHRPGTVTASSRPIDPAGDGRAVEDDGGRARARGVLGRAAGVAAGGDERDRGPRPC